MSRSTNRALSQHRVSIYNILRRLKMCGWYWGELSSQQANTLLRDAQNGSFILRDSNDACHLFTLSLKAHNFVISVRVTFSRGQFKLDSCHQEDSPSFHSMVDLVDYYLASEHRHFYVNLPDVGEFPVALRHPIWKEAPSLQHLCRRKVVQCCPDCHKLRQLPMPSHLIQYLVEFAPEEEPDALASSRDVPSLQQLCSKAIVETCRDLRKLPLSDQLVDHVLDLAASKSLER